MWLKRGKFNHITDYLTKYNTQGPVKCQEKVKTVVVDNPIEECDMEPLRTCKHITKLVPKLEPTQDCVDVPKEICAMSKVNPRRKRKHFIQKWCYTPKSKTGSIKLDKVMNDPYL